MKYLNVIFIIVFTILIFSCGNGYDKEILKRNFEEQVKIDLPEDFQIINYETSFSIGGDTETYTIVLKNEDFSNFFKKIKEVNFKESEKGIFSKDIQISNDENCYVTVDKNKALIHYHYIDL